MPKDFYVVKQGRNSFDIVQRGGGIADTHDNRQGANVKAREYQKELNARRRGNPMTKTQKTAKAARSRKKSLKARAAHALLRIMNPAGIKKVHAVRVKRLKGGGVSILPVKAVKR